MYWELCQTNDPAKPLSGDPRRRHGRLSCSMATSTLGDVLDVSAGGMRVHSSIKLEKGQSVIVTLGTPVGPLPVQCTVMWVKRSKLFWYQLGLRFDNLNDAARRYVNEFARAASNQEVVRPSVKQMVTEMRKAS